MKKTFKTVQAFAVAEKSGDEFVLDLYYYEDGKTDTKKFKSENALLEFLNTLGNVEERRTIKRDPDANQSPGPLNRMKTIKGRKNKAVTSKTAKNEVSKQRVPLTVKNASSESKGSGYTDLSALGFYPTKSDREGDHFTTRGKYKGVKITASFDNYSIYLSKPFNSTFNGRREMLASVKAHGFTEDEFWADVEKTTLSVNLDPRDKGTSVESIKAAIEKIIKNNEHMTKKYGTGTDNHAAATKKPAKKHQKMQPKGNFIIYQETQFGMQPLSDEYDVPLKFTTKEDADFYIESMIADDPKLDTDAFRVVNGAKKKAKREFFSLTVRPAGEKTKEQGYLDWYWFAPVAKRAINPDTGRTARRYKLTKPGKGSQFVTFDVGSKEERQIPGVQGLGYTVGLNKKIIKGFKPGDVVFGSKLHVQRILIERDVLKLDPGYTTGDLEGVIKKIYGEWLLKDLSRDFGKQLSTFTVIPKGSDYVILFK